MVVIKNPIGRPFLPYDSISSSAASCPLFSDRPTRMWVLKSVPYNSLDSGFESIWAMIYAGPVRWFDPTPFHFPLTRSKAQYWIWKYLLPLFFLAVRGALAVPVSHLSRCSADLSVASKSRRISPAKGAGEATAKPAAATTEIMYLISSFHPPIFLWLHSRSLYLNLDLFSNCVSSPSILT